jgi:hypothetical protein
VGLAVPPADREVRQGPPDHADLGQEDLVDLVGQEVPGGQVAHRKVRLREVHRPRNHRNPAPRRA